MQKFNVIIDMNLSIYQRLGTFPLRYEKHYNDQQNEHIKSCNGIRGYESPHI